MAPQLHWGSYIAHYQGDPDWTVIKNAVAAETGGTLRFCWIKATEGTSYGWTSWYQRNLDAIRAAGLLTAAWHWLKHGNGSGQAEYFWDRVQGDGLSTFAVDVEESDVVWADVVAFFQRWNEITPPYVKLAIYTRKWFWKTARFGNPRGIDLTPYLWAAGPYGGKPASGADARFDQEFGYWEPENIVDLQWGSWTNTPASWNVLDRTLPGEVFYGELTDLQSFFGPLDVTGLPAGTFRTPFARWAKDLQTVASGPSTGELRPVGPYKGVTYLDHGIPWSVDFNRYTEGGSALTDLGDPVVASADGTVAYYDSTLGWVKLSHTGGYYTGYIHMWPVVVEMGQVVKRGQVLGYINGRRESNNNYYGPHLHVNHYSGGMLNADCIRVKYQTATGGSLTNVDASIETPTDTFLGSQKWYGDTADLLPNLPPVIAVSRTPNGVAPLTVAFTNTTTDPEDGASGLTWVWKADGVTFSTAKSPSRLFSTPGTFIVELTATDADGASAQRLFTVRVDEPTAVIDPDPDIVCQEEGEAP